MNDMATIDNQNVNVVGTAFLIKGNKITFQMNLLGGYQFQDYNVRVYVNNDQFQNQSSLCTASDISSSSRNYECSGLDVIMPIAFVTIYFNIEDPIFKSITLFRINSYGQDKTNYIIFGSGFDLLDSSKLSIFDNYGPGTYLNIISIESNLITASLIPISPNTKGSFIFYYELQEIVTMNNNNFYPYISSLTPTIVNSGRDILVVGIFLIDNLLSAFKFSMQDSIQTPTFEYIDKNNAIIRNSVLDPTKYYGGVSVLYQHIVYQGGAVQINSDSYEDLIFFATSKISTSTFDFIAKTLTITGVFMIPSTTVIPFYIYGISMDPIQASAQSPSIVTFSLKDIQLFYGKTRLVIDSTETLFDSNSVIQSLAPTPLEINKPIEKDDQIVYFSGRFLLQKNQLDQVLYQVSLYKSTSDEHLPCTDIQILSYNQNNMIYNISCKTQSTVYPLVTDLIITSNDTNPISIPMKYVSFSIDSVSSTIYGIPNQIVTIIGINLNIVESVLIGGFYCTNINYILTSTNTYSLECLFISNVGTVNSELPVLAISNNGANFTFNSFIYGIDKPCPIGSNGLVCSGPTNGKCLNITRECVCNKGFASFDCSTKITDSTPPIPKINETTTIIETSTSKFEIGLIQIREIETFNQNKLIKFIDLKKQIWSLSSTVTSLSNITTYTYNTTIEGTCIVKVLISVYKSTLNGDQSNQYNFFGDLINILPNSIKYNIEITNWQFQGKLNSIQVIFQSKVENQCQDNKEVSLKNIDKIGESIRSIELKLSTGEILVGKFSNRMKIDDRIVISNIELLSNEEFSSSTTSDLLIQAINVGFFNKSVVIDPNFGVLLSSNENNGDCNEKSSRKWVIPVAVVVSVVGAATIATALFLILRKNTTIKVQLHKLKRLNK